LKDSKFFDNQSSEHHLKHYEKIFDMHRNRFQDWRYDEQYLYNCLGHSYEHFIWTHRWGGRIILEYSFLLRLKNHSVQSHRETSNKIILVKVQSQKSRTKKIHVKYDLTDLFLVNCKCLSKLKIGILSFWNIFGQSVCIIMMVSIYKCVSGPRLNKNSS